jgi:hypothetical protein
MAFDMGFNFRASAGYVTDGPEGVAELGYTYPHTYTNGNGYSINGGWSGPGTFGANDRNSGNDPRIAGRAYAGATNSTNTFSVDLSSGSAPGTGNYTLDLAAGDDGNISFEIFRVTDGTTTFVDTGTTALFVLAGHYLDANLTDIAATTLWTGVPLAITAGNVTINLDMNYGGANSYSTIAHFRLTLQAAANVIMPRMLMLLGVGA